MIVNVVSGNVYFVLPIFNIHGRKMRFSASSQKSVSEKSIFGPFEVIFSTYKFFQRRGWLFPNTTLKEEFFDEKMSSLAGLKKSYSISRKSTDFGHFRLTGSIFKIDFLNVGENFFEISLKGYLREVVRNLMLIFERSISSGLRGGGGQPFCRSTFSKIRDFS